MNAHLLTRRLPRNLVTTIAAVTTSLVFAAAAGAHAELTPAVSLYGRLQLYSLAVPTEKEGVTTTKVVLSVPSGFGIDSFVPPPPGWRQQLQQIGSGEAAVVTKVTWTGGKTPTGQDSLFQFLAQPSAQKTFTFNVQQTYSDGSIVNWSGPANSDTPAPTVAAKSSLGGGGVSVLTIIALIVGVLGLLAGGLALSGGAKPRALA